MTWNYFINQVKTGKEMSISLYELVPDDAIEKCHIGA